MISIYDPLVTTLHRNSKDVDRSARRDMDLDTYNDTSGKVFEEFLMVLDRYDKGIGNSFVKITSSYLKVHR